MKFIDVSRVRSRFDEQFLASDGIRLSADVYMPPEEGRYPTLITRTPYDNNHTSLAPGATTLSPSPADRCKKLAALGFLVVACDVRGRGDSEGTFVPFASEAQDGADTVEWARTLPESSGHVGVFGNGYAGFAALSAATATRVEAVAAWSPFALEGTPFRGGVVRQDWLFWMHLVGGRTPQPVDVPLWHEIFRARPIASMHYALGQESTPWTDWLEGTADLRSLDLTEQLASLGSPALLVTGWWDSAVSSTLDYWDILSRASTNADHALVVGPWDVEGVRRPCAVTGGIDWGPSAVVDPDDLLVQWFAAHLTNAGETTSGARIFLTGRNEWITPDFEASGRRMTLWLNSGGKANTRRGDGRLSSVDCDSPPDSFIHDPDNPVPWQASGVLFSRSSSKKLSLDTALQTSRDDVLVYRSEPTSSGFVICGRPTAIMWTLSDADDSDWVVSIEDVFPGGGRSVHLAHGIVRTNAVRGARTDGPIELAIELTPVAHEILPGHFVRLLIGSSLWPLYAVNLGGSDYLGGTEPHVSVQRVFHDRSFPSRIEIPITSHEPADEASTLR